MSSSLTLYVTIDNKDNKSPKNNQQFKVPKKNKTVCFVSISLIFILKADDFVTTFYKWIQVTTNFNLILSELRNEDKDPPFGQHLLNYKLKGEESSPYFIYCIKKDVFLDLKFRQWFSRLELLPFFPIIFHLLFIRKIQTGSFIFIINNIKMIINKYVMHLLDLLQFIYVMLLFIKNDQKSSKKILVFFC